MLRPFNPLDFPSLLFLQARAHPNQAYSRQALATAPARFLPAGSIVRDWVMQRPSGRACICSHRGLLGGIVYARRRRRNANWDVGWLQVAKGREGEVADLLSSVSAALAETGAEKIFLRLPESSLVQTFALDAGFIPYVNEELYLRPRGAHLTGGWEPAAGTLCDAGPTAAWDSYRFYQRVVPEKTRETEGLTLNQRQDWLDLPRGWRQRSAHVLERDGVVMGWSSVLGRGGSSVLDILVDPSDWDLGQTMIGAAIDSVGQRSSIRCVLPEYQQPLAGALGALGFNKVGEFTSYARPLAARVKERKLVPVGASS